MISLELLLVVAALTLAFLVFLLVVLPEALKWLAPRNQKKYQALKKQFEGLENLLLQSASQLHPFRDLKAERYRQNYEEARSQLRLARDDYKAAGSLLAKMVLVKFPDSRWAISFLIYDPKHVVTIPSDLLRLRRCKRFVISAEATLTAAGQKQDELDKLPQALKQECRELAEQRLPAVSAMLQAERQAGIVALDELTTRLEKMQGQAAGLGKALQLNPDAPVEEVDELAHELDNLSADAVTLDADVRALHQARQQLDTSLRALESALNELKQTVPEEQTSQLMPQLIAHVEGQLRQSRQLRADAKFEQAQAINSEGQAFVVLGNQITLTRQAVQTLAQLQFPAGLVDRYKDLTSEWTQLLKRTTSLLQTDESGPDLQTADTTVERVQQMILVAQDLQNRAGELRAEHEHVLAEEERSVDQAFERLTRAWGSLGKTIPLSGEDPLAQRYYDLLSQRERAHGNPMRLDEVSGASAILSTDLEEADKSLQEDLVSAHAVLDEVRRLAKDAERDAGDWVCLQRQAQDIINWMVKTEDLMGTLTASGLLSETHRRLIECTRLGAKARDAYTTMVEESEQLSQLEDAIERTVGAVRDQPGNLDPVAIERSMSLINQYHNDAKVAADFSRAKFLLGEARSVARQLVVR